ncbi:MAG: hypothetical protein KF773_30640 [Deltaproteobacteria bacterium]|nr:hypothetical protein [Deltaproteobacteria bacterium]MCW5802660.1 hypothetical protein [Deltaproteobacteria bacterium]
MRMIVALIVACVCASTTHAAAPAVRVTITCAKGAFDENAVRRIVLEALSREAVAGARQLDVSVELTHVDTGNHTDVSARLGLIVSDDRGAMQSRVVGGATVRVPVRSLAAGGVQAVDTALKGIAAPLRDHLAKR